MSDPENHQAEGTPAPSDRFNASITVTNATKGEIVLTIAVVGERYECQRTVQYALRGFDDRPPEEDRFQRVLASILDALPTVLRATGAVAPPPPEPMPRPFWRPIPTDREWARAADAAAAAAEAANQGKPAAP